MIKLDIKEEDMPEFLGNLIDVVEDFLEEKGIDIPNEERDENDEDNQAIIYGGDYDDLSDAFQDVLENWSDKGE